MQPPSAWLSLELDPGTASFFGLPERVQIPAPEDGALPVADGRLSMTGLGEALTRAAAEHPEVLARSEIRRFLDRWPRYADLDRYLRVGNGRFARQVAEQLLKDDPEDPPARVTLACLAAGEDRWQEAAQGFLGALERAPNYAPARLHLALASAAAGDRAGELEHLERLAEHPRYQALVRLWEHEVRARDAASLAACLDAGLQPFLHAEEAGNQERWEQLASVLPENPEVLFTRALAPDAEVNDNDRVAILERVLALRPDHAEAACALALQHRAGNEPARALQVLDAALKNRPGEPLVHAHRGLCLELLGRPGEALESYREVFRGPLARIPATALPLAGMGLLRLGPLDTATRALEEASAARPYDPVPERLLALVDERTRGPEAAEQRLRTALRSRAPHPLLHYALGDLLRRQGRRVEAEGLFKAIRKRHPDSPLGPRGLGDVWVEEQPARALEHYREAASRDPLTPMAGYEYLLGVAALREGLLDPAEAHFHRALAVEPDNPRTWCDLGAVQFHAGKLPAAMASGARAVALEPRHPGFRHNLAVYYREAFAKTPWRVWLLWKAWRMKRHRHTAAPENWRRDLWQGPEAGPKAE